MSNCLHDLLYMIPITLIATILSAPYLGGPKNAAVIGLSLLVLGILTLIKHGKTRLKFIIPGVMLAVAIAVFFLSVQENRLEFLLKNLWVAYSAGIALGAFLTGWLWAENRIARRVLTLAVLAGLILDMILWGICTKAVVALALLLLLLAIADEVQHYWKKSGYPERKKHLVSIAVFLILIAVSVYYIPAPEKPFDWSFAVRAVQKVSSFVRSHTVWLHNGEENYEAVIGFSDHGEFTDRLGDSRKEIMFLTVDQGGGGEIYLSGKTFDTFNGRSWSENYKEANTDRAMDTMELLCAVDAYDFAHTKDYIRRSNAKIQYRDFYTNYCFAPPKAVPEGAGFEGIVYEQSGGNLISPKQLGFGTEYKVSYYNLNLEHENFKSFLDNPAPIEEKNWNRIKNQYSFTAGLNYEDYPAYREKIRNIYLPETKLSAEAEAYLDELLKDCDSDYERLCYMENALSSFAYTRTPGDIPEDVDSEAEYLDYFLFEKKEGYCVHFATAMVLMARSRGIPARMVQGFRVDAKGGTTMDVRSDTGHAWAEAYIDGVGWLTFDATPGEHHNLYWMSTEERWVYGSPDAKNEKDKKDDWKPEKEEESKKERKPFDPRFVYLPLIAVAVFVILFAIFDRIIRLAAYRRLPAEAKYLSVCRKNFKILSALGYTHEDGETIAEYAARIAGEEKKDPYAFFEEYERICYADRPMPEDALTIAEADQKALYQALRRKKGKVFGYILLKLSR